MGSIILYKNASDARTVTKTLSGAASYEFIPRGSFTVTGGTARIESATNLSGYNYAYIEDFNRYYFIDGITSERANIWLFNLRCDVLMTYATQIKNLTGTIDRSETLRDGYLTDSQYIAKQYKQIVTKEFPNGMTDDTIILLTVG